MLNDKELSKKYGIRVIQDSITGSKYTLKVNFFRSIPYKSIRDIFRYADTFEQDSLMFIRPICDHTTGGVENRFSLGTLEKQFVFVLGKYLSRIGIQHDPLYPEITLDSIIFSEVFSEYRDQILRDLTTYSIIKTTDIAIRMDNEIVVKIMNYIKLNYYDYVHDAHLLYDLDQPDLKDAKYLKKDHRLD